VRGARSLSSLTCNCTCRPDVSPLPLSFSAPVRGQGSGAMWPRGSARQPLLCNTGAPAHSASPPCPPVAVQTAPRVRDRFSRRCVAGSLLFRYPVQPRVLCAATQQTQSTDGVFFNRAPELGRLRQVLGSPPTSVLVLTGPPSCGKSGACRVCALRCADKHWQRLRPDSPLRAALLKHLVSETARAPKPSIIDCRAGGACLHAGLTRWPWTCETVC